jgi:hypothetical protein
MKFKIFFAVSLVLTFWLGFQPLSEIVATTGAASSYYETPRRGETEELWAETNLRNLANNGYVRLLGGWEWGDVDGMRNVIKSRFNDATIEGTFDGSYMTVYLQQAGQVFEMELDNRAPFTVQIPNNGKYSYVRLTGQIPDGRHNFRLRLVNRANRELHAYSFHIKGTWVKQVKDEKSLKIMGYGSSTMDFCGITWTLARKKGWETINRGIGGSTVIHHGQHRVETDVIPFKPDVLLINYGSNDWYANLPVPEFKTAFVNMLRQMDAGLPKTTKFIVMGIFPRKGGSEASRKYFNRAMQEAIHETGLLDRSRYFEVSNYNWQTDTNDGTHPTPDAVREKFVPQLLPLVEFN